MINEEETKKLFGARLTEARKLCGITQLALAEKINYSDKAVSKWERGESLCPYTTLFRSEPPRCFHDNEDRRYARSDHVLSPRGGG